MLVWLRPAWGHAARELTAWGHAARMSWGHAAMTSWGHAARTSTAQLRRHRRHQSLRVGRDRDANAGGGQRAQLRGRELSESACEPRAPDGPAPPHGRRGEEQAQPHREVLHGPAVAQAPAELGDGDFSWRHVFVFNFRCVPAPIVSNRSPPPRPLEHISYPFTPSPLRTLISSPLLSSSILCAPVLPSSLSALPSSLSSLSLSPLS